jgi:hypothetical protein
MENVTIPFDHYKLLILGTYRLFPCTCGKGRPLTETINEKIGLFREGNTLPENTPNCFDEDIAILQNFVKNYPSEELINYRGCFVWHMEEIYDNSEQSEDEPDLELKSNLDDSDPNVVTIWL